MRLQLPDRPVYVGETFVAEIHLYALGGNLKQVPQLQADGFTLGKVVDGGQEGNIRTNNRIYSRARFLQPITAARSGKLQVQASNCILDVQLASRRGGGASDFFEEAFFGLRETKRLTLASAPGTIEVLPLPRTGVPVGFSGAVGEFEIQLSATPTNARAGDPITLRIDLAGKGNFDSVQWTEPPEWKEFRVYPPNATFATEDQLGIEGTKKFEQVVTPESPSITALPAASFSFFSPATRAYRTIRTAAVPLMVAPGAAAPAIPSPTGAGATAAPTQAPPELAPLRHHLGAWTATRATEPSHGLLLALTGLPWIGWLGWRASVQVRRHFGADAVTLRRRALASSIRKGLDSLAGTAQAGDSDAFFTQLFRILQESVALRADLPPAAITEGDLESVLKPHGVGDATLQSLHHLFQRCNDARYAPVRTPADLESVRQETARVVRELTPGT